MAHLRSLTVPVLPSTLTVNARPPSVTIRSTISCDGESSTTTSGGASSIGSNPSLTFRGNRPNVTTGTGAADDDHVDDDEEEGDVTGTGEGAVTVTITGEEADTTGDRVAEAITTGTTGDVIVAAVTDVGGDNDLEYDVDATVPNGDRDDGALVFGGSSSSHDGIRSGTPPPDDDDDDNDALVNVGLEPGDACDGANVGDVVVTGGDNEPGDPALPDENSDGPLGGDVTISSIATLIPRSRADGSPLIYDTARK
jgi:hypothetical protein